MRYILSVTRTSLGYSLLLFSVGVVHLSSAQSYKHFRLGNPQDVQTKLVAGIARLSRFYWRRIQFRFVEWNRGLRLFPCP